MKISNSRRQRKIWLVLLLAFVVIAQIGYAGPKAGIAEAADNGLAMKPYMGWSSYSMQVYDGPSGNWISEAKLKQMSDAMHEKLQAHGYEYINIDASWNGGMDDYGRPIPSTEKYPNGFENLIDYIHGNGQKVGIYLIPGVSPEAVTRNLPIYNAPGCFIGDIVVKPYKFADYWNIGYKIDFNNPCAQKYIDSIADLIASWGVDLVKFDSVTPGSGHNDETIDARGDVKAWSEALSRHGIWFELSWALDHNYVDYWKKYANGWRVDWDVEAYDREVGMTQWANIARLFPDAALWWRDAGPGGWNDFDSLDIGNGATSGLTRDERQTAATLWAASSAQFFTGDDLSNLDDYGLELLTNDEVIAVNQAGRPVHPVSTATNQQVWYANNGDGTYTVALFNLGNKGASVNVNWSDIGLNGTASSVRDLWSHRELGAYATGYNAYLEPHASRLFKVTAANGTSLVNDDDTGMRYSGEWTRNGGNELVRDAQDLSVVVSDSSASGSGSGDQSGGDNTPPSGSDTGSGGNTPSVSQVVYVNDNDTGIQYSNKWGYSSGRSLGDYMNDIHYGELGNDGITEPELTYAFSGTGIEVLAEKSTGTSPMDIYLDDNFIQTVDGYGDTQSGQYSVYSVSGLASGPHTLRIVRNPNPNRPYLQIDAFKVTTDSLIGAPSASTFNKDQPTDITTELTLGSGSLTGIKNGATTLQPNTDFTVSGNVVTIKKEYWQQQLSGQSTVLTFGFAGGASQNLSVAVTGTSISPTSASFDKRPTAQANLAVTLTLGDGNSLTGIKNGTAELTPVEDYTVTGNVVTLSKTYLAGLAVGTTNLTFEFSLSSSRTLAVAVTNSASPGRYAMINDDDPGIRYTGSWGRSTGRPFGDYNGDVHYVEPNGDSFTYSFNGTGISYITEVDQGQGDVDIYIDGQLHGTAITYDANAHNNAQQTVYTVSGLTPGIHVLQAVKKSGQFMLVDALKVRQTDLIDVSSVDFDKAASAQADVSVNVLGSIDSLDGITNGASTLIKGVDYTISGNRVTIKKEYLATRPVGTTKMTFRFKGDNADDVHAATANGDFFEFKFKGTGIELLSPTGPSQGDMDVYLDGVLKQTVSALSTIRGSQVSLYSASSLANGVHTIKVVKKTGSLMLVDALEYNVAGATSVPPSGGGIDSGAGSGDPATVKIVRTTQPDGTAKDEVKLTADAAKALIDKTKAAGATATVVAFTDAKDETSLTSVTLDKDSIALIAKSGLGLDIDTANAKIKIPNASLSGFGDDAYFNLVPVKSGEKSKEIEQRANGATIVLAATSGKKVTVVGRPVEIETNVQNHEVTIVLPLGDLNLSASDLDSLGVYIEHSDGTKEFKKGVVTTFDGGKGLQFTISKFSTFTIVKAEGASVASSHSAYMQGFEGGLFKPEKVITRAEMATILSRVANRDSTESGRTYSDVKAGYWASDAITKVTGMGLMSGFSDGSFKPEQPISRAEMAALATRFAASGSNATGTGIGFKDITGNWAEQAIKSAQSVGYMKGYADGTFRPGNSLTRAEAVVILNRMLGRGPLYGVEQSPWKDVPNNHWAIRDIDEASLDHSFAPRTGGGEQAVR
jgi:hypothetical protein